jgi:hypothetical protein
MVPDPTDPSDQGPNSRLSAVRAGLVMVAFVVAVGALVAVGTRPSVSGDALATATTTTLAGKHHAIPTTTTTTAPHSSVSVVVANGTSTDGQAAHYTAVLAPGGWNMQTPTDATTTVATSAVYYAAGEQEAAASIATTIGVTPANVLPLTTAVPVSGVSGIDVVVVIGANLVASG